MLAPAVTTESVSSDGQQADATADRPGRYGIADRPDYRTVF
ncbi:MAG: hypothetical protein J07HX64_02386 [halophilic archaeon J07HX64]|nr:MAG: hypothetical protein J07HX64_02386 [halophilic archaeon J07HX64]